MNATDAVGRLSKILGSLAAQGFVTRPLVADPPASPGEVDAVEGQLGCRLPMSLRRCLATVASRLEFAWFAPPEHTFPGPFHEIFSGNLCWSLNGLPELMTAVRGWVDNVFPDPSDPYDRVWHHKLPFMEVGNGDYLALDLNEDAHGRVVYLSHDDGEGHGRTMAPSFEDLLIRWIPLACPGAEDSQWLPFCAPSDGGLDPSSARAHQWTALVRPKNGPSAVEGL
ncbi:hypothetical protein GCM10029963_24570 [Micromonospora andamanensis]|uniref:SMI1/KNR4 family protein n=1 Tax=Micromonospora andamanensis TaxID=1287068 RepID=UPI00194DE914|nr:SMI1/KNR4 family protein [Micromonospora andamanensis]GIJ38343.1 hypothetical protein Vwe01_16680 [Micromonospora andamanensis]